MHNVNLIQSHADQFIDHFEVLTQYNYKEFIDAVRMNLYDYHKDIYKIQYVEHLILRFKQSYDKHEEKCTYKPKERCPERRIHENILFFLQEEMDELERGLDEEYFNKPYRDSLDHSMNEILARFDKLDLGQQITYDDLFEEIQELKSFYFLSKKNWLEMLAGKLSTMVAGGIISETISKEIVDLLQEKYADLIK